jgi:hypothetical protein
LHHISTNLKRFERQTHAKEGLIGAAVAITIVNIQRDPDIHDIKVL